MHMENCHFVTCVSRKVYKSLMSERYRELKWTCPICSIKRENIPPVMSWFCGHPEIFRNTEISQINAQALKLF